MKNLPNNQNKILNNIKKNLNNNNLNSLSIVGLLHYQKRNISSQLQHLIKIFLLMISVVGQIIDMNNYINHLFMNNLSHNKLLMVS